MTKDYKLVHFEEYCKRCKHYEKPVSEDPCNHCLTIPARENSHKPENYEEK